MMGEKQNHFPGIVNILIAAPLLVSTASCGMAADPPLPPGATRRLTIDVNYPDLVETAMPAAIVAVAGSNFISAGKVYVDGNRTGNFTFNSRNTIDIPASARSLELHLADVIGSGSSSISDTMNFRDPGSDEPTVVICSADRLADLIREKFVCHQE